MSGIKLIEKTLCTLDFKFVKKILLKTDKTNVDITILSELIYKYNGDKKAYLELFEKSESFEWILYLKTKKNHEMHFSYDIKSEVPICIETIYFKKKTFNLETELKKLKYNEICALYFNFKNSTPWIEVEKLIDNIDIKTLENTILSIKKSKKTVSYPSFVAHIYLDKIYIRCNAKKYDLCELETFVKNFNIFKIYMDDKALKLENWMSQLKPDAKKTVLYIKNKNPLI